MSGESDEEDRQLGLAFEERVETQELMRVVQEQMSHETRGFVGAPRVTGVRVGEDVTTIEADVVLEVPMNYIRLTCNIGEDDA